MADMKVAEMGGETPVGTTMAMERGTKVMSAIHKRLHYSQKVEFKLLANVFAKFMAPMYPYAIPGAPPEIKLQILMIELMFCLFQTLTFSLCHSALP